MTTDTDTAVAVGARSACTPFVSSPVFGFVPLLSLVVVALLFLLLLFFFFFSLSLCSFVLLLLLLLCVVGVWVCGGSRVVFEMC